MTAVGNGLTRTQHEDTSYGRASRRDPLDRWDAAPFAVVGSVSTIAGGMMSTAIRARLLCGARNSRTPWSLCDTSARKETLA